MTCAVGTAGKFVSADRGAIKTMANVVGNVAKSGLMIASADKQAQAAVTKPLEQVLLQKSIDILQQLACTKAAPPWPATMQDISRRIAGASFKMLESCR